MKTLTKVLAILCVGINRITSLPFDNRFISFESNLSKMGNVENFGGNLGNHRVPNGASERFTTGTQNVSIPISANKADANATKCNVKAFEGQFHKIGDSLLEVANKANSRGPNESKLSANPGPDAVVNCQRETIVETTRDHDLGPGVSVRSSSITNSESYSVESNRNTSDTESFELAKRLGIAL